jgi:hypothetical protein
MPLRAQQPLQTTPLRSFPSNVNNYDGPADRGAQPAMTTLKPSGPTRPGSEPRSRTGATFAANGNPRMPQATQISKEDAIALKMDVPRTTAPKAPAMKHQMSQSSDASGQERGYTRHTMVDRDAIDYARCLTQHFGTEADSNRIDLALGKTTKATMQVPRSMRTDGRISGTVTMKSRRNRRLCFGARCLPKVDCS